MFALKLLHLDGGSIKLSCCIEKIIWYNIYIVYFVILLEVFLVMSGKMTGYALFNRNNFKRVALCHALFLFLK